MKKLNKFDIAGEPRPGRMSHSKTLHGRVNFFAISCLEYIENSIDRISSLQKLEKFSGPENIFFILSFFLKILLIKVYFHLALNFKFINSRNGFKVIDVVLVTSTGEKWCPGNGFSAITATIKPLIYFLYWIACQCNFCEGNSFSYL